ncbi:MAG: hypothetical protein H6712_33150 [Myxococcales bacterium]|nr:hypothetical protein [Myxococcales bacterium]
MTSETERFTPEFDYSHILHELSVNRKDPCEVIRELISNSYDAGASAIWIIPLHQYGGFLFVDNGSGISYRDKINGITPWQAFFSIGKSTKQMGMSIGYKCQGSKLCFASTEFSLMSRCEGDSLWSSIHLDNPKRRLTGDSNIYPRFVEDPLVELSEHIDRPDERSQSVLGELRGVLSELKTGTIIMVKRFETSSYEQYFVPGERYYYLREYVRFSTRHGDIRILNPAQTGFPQSAASSFRAMPGYNDAVSLRLWRGESWEDVLPGYPYLHKTDEQAKDPSELARLRDGRFTARHAKAIKHSGRTYALVLAVDGNRRALEGHQELDRQGRAGGRSGLRIVDQRGTFVCSQGIKVAPYNQIFDHPALSEYDVLSTGDAQAHYVFMIDGSFELVTNRNAITEQALQVLRDPDFCDKIALFLQEAERKSDVFRQLIQRMKRSTEVHRLQKYLGIWSEAKTSLTTRERFSVPYFGERGRSFLSPRAGEEHWVAALYTLFSHSLQDDMPYRDLWLVPKNYSAVGIDCIATTSASQGLKGKLLGLEFKFSFSPKDGFNHPLIETCHIVAWELSDIEEGDTIRDDFDYFGEIERVDELDGVGYRVVGLESDSGEVSDNVVTVLSLRELLKRTFGAKFRTPPPRK